MPQLLSHRLLEQAAGARCGLVPPVSPVDPQPCDRLGPIFDGKLLANAAVPKDPVNAWQTVSGAVALDSRGAIAGAIAEALERLAAAQATLTLRMRSQLVDDERLDDDVFALFSSEQRAQPDFPWPMVPSPDDLYAPVYRLADNQMYWVPQELVGLGPRSGQARMPSTSSGLAAWRDEANGPWLAVLRAAQELLERDALATTWLNGLGGRQLSLPVEWTDYVAASGGEIAAFDLTQAWNPHRVVAVAGGLPYAGHPRFVLGVACRANLSEALHKALLEWAQALTFASHLADRGDDLPRQPDALRRFDQHAVFYTLRPDLWRQTALMEHATPHVERAFDAVTATRRTRAESVEAAMASAVSRTMAADNVCSDVSGCGQSLAQLRALQVSLTSSGIDLYYRELTTVDVAATGLRVMRVLSPQLSGLHADERAPFLGGRCADIQWRYPGSVRHTAFPNPLPHPLG
ncbi:YcaO-like family protein [Bordetella muralis]|uniref:YcaO-like family protein n=1 Tax=Bordetella muralis TaxID=1649130 RepID=UPI0039EEEBBF